MITSILSVICSLYFLYLYKWTQSRLSQEYSFGSPSPPKPLPHSITISISISILYGLIILRGIMAGYITTTDNYFSIKSDGLELIFLFVTCLALILSYKIIYHLGEINGVINMKNTSLFRQYLNKE